MATNVPPALKTADITRFAIRAAQVEKAKPAAAYWCYYYVLDKILSNGLHKTDDQCQAYVVSLMDKVEQMKTEHADDEAIKDEMTAKAYMEQFGTETFLRADNAIRSNKASKVTADAFQAANTFLGVLAVWGPLDKETADKIKFAKFHAVRILKAIKAGEDPNASNPAPEPEEELAPELDVNDPEVQAIAGIGPSSESFPAPLDTSDQNVPPQFIDQAPVSPPEAPISLPPYPNENSSRSTQSMPPHHPAEEDFYQKSVQPDVSPLPASEGGGYFPEVPGDDGIPSPVLPGPPSNHPGISHSPALSPAPQNASYNQYSAPNVPQFPGPPGHGTQAQPPMAPVAAPAFRAPPSRPSAPPAPPPQPYVPVAADVDDEAMARAQKHARFAISALNFEDVSTAVKELRAALADLGQS